MDKMTAEQALVPLAELFKEREAVFAAMRNMSSDDSLDYGYTDRVADIEAEVLAIISALSAPRVPVGWKLVPVEPTEDMMFASFDATYGQADTRSIYTAMLAASPEPVAPDAQQVIADLRAEVEALREDAARYRWLREGTASGWLPSDEYEPVLVCATPLMSTSWREDVDKAIDSARLREGGE